MREKWLALLVLAAGCPSVAKDKDDGLTPYVEFDPANSIIPFPNNLVLDPTTGKVHLPVQACDSPSQAALKTGVLNQLDGFGTFEVGIQITATEAIDVTSVSPANVLLYKRLAGTTALDPSSAQPIPFVAQAGSTVRFDPNGCSPSLVPALNIVPTVPLDPNSTYTLALLDTAQSALGGGYHASFVWGLVRQSVDPVAFDSSGNVTVNNTPVPWPTSTSPTDPSLVELQGIDLLWKAHAKALAFLDGTGKLSANRANVLVATDFTTQTTTKPLDPTVAGSPASTLGGTPLLGTQSIADARGRSCDNTGANPAGCTAFLNSIGLPCNALPCNKVGDVLAAGLTVGASMYEQPTPNPFDANLPIPGPWTDPLAPTVQGPWQKTDYLNPSAPPAGVIEVVAFIPQASTMPVNGWPTVVFQHGLTRSKEDLFAVGSQLAAAGFAAVAIDLQLHGSRAVPISNSAQLGCAGVCMGGTTACDTITACAGGATCVNGLGVSVGPTASPQCYAPVISTNLAATRDVLRQSVLDQLRLVKAIAACGTTNCVASNGRALAVDPNHIVYMGQSLGGIVGSISNSVAPNIQAGVLNVTGVGVVDILENTPEQTFRATYVNALIDAGLLMGTHCSPTDPTVGLCKNQDWLQQPGYGLFAPIERWVLDAADPANYVGAHGSFAGLAAKHFLQQEVVNDQVVPNLTSDDEGKLLGQTPMNADVPTASPPAPSAAITTNPTASKWVRYTTVPGTVAYWHGSILAPADSGMPDGLAGTAVMQTDAITYLLLNH